MTSTLAFFERARSFGERPAIVDPDGTYSYRDLVDAAVRVAAVVTQHVDSSEAEPRVAFLVPPSFDYAAVMWGVWRAGGIAVPLALAYPQPELEYAVGECDAALLIADPELAPRLEPIARERRIPLLGTDAVLVAGSAGQAGSQVPAVDPRQGALILFTSGTTGRPKGAVLTHANVQAQVESLAQAWAWSRDDRILEILPLHHLHGIINILSCALWSGALCEILPRFDAEEVWNRILGGRITLLMAVPTIYVRLIAAWEAAGDDRRRTLSRAVRGLRLMVSGSAALPVPVLESWRRISGQVLLERYGMTEIGMALSNPLDGERVAGAVGAPLPGVEVRIVGEDGRPLGDDEAGEVEVRGPTVFREYWRRDQATRESFRRDAWFRTGDVGIREQGVYRLLGRQSVDIIKCGGEKISALEIESVLAGHPAIRDCAVVGMPDPEWGHRVAAAVVLEDGTALDLDGLRGWCKERLAVYKVPSALHLLDELPRNAMGKVTKPAVAELISEDLPPAPRVP
ncbi:MAG: acyl-CoA synthetase [Thermoanaerobaculia bacterium]